MAAGFPLRKKVRGLDRRSYRPRPRKSDHMRREAQGGVLRWMDEMEVLGTKEAWKTKKNYISNCTLCTSQGQLK